MAKDDEDSIVFRSRAALADYERGEKLPPLDEMTGRPKMGPFDISQIPEGVRYMPKYLSVDKDSQALGSKIIGTKKLGKNTALQGYYDVDTTNDKYEGLKNRRGGAGFTLMHNYAKGGTASARADGIAARGKTKGRLL
jgi:hypothetical protein